MSWLREMIGGGLRRRKYQVNQRKSIDNQHQPLHVDPARKSRVKRTFSFEGTAVITFKPNAEGNMLHSNEVAVFLRDGWVDIRGDDGRLTTVPREEIFEIEWVSDV